MRVDIGPWAGYRIVNQRLKNRRDEESAIRKQARLVKELELTTRRETRRLQDMIDHLK